MRKRLRWKDRTERKPKNQLLGRFSGTKEAHGLRDDFAKDDNHSGGDYNGSDTAAKDVI